MVFGLIRRWRRNRLLKAPWPEAWTSILREYLPFYDGLDETTRARFHGHVRIFEREKYFFGASGLEVTETMRVVISAVAARLILQLDLSFYDRLTEIVIYPHDYQHKEGNAVILGEAHDFGTVVLSWPAVLAGLADPHDGHDTALHEFAHVLDRANGRFNGTPSLRAKEHYRAWARVMSSHFNALRAHDPREEEVLRDYGGTNEAEFFAVATESFFEKPHKMRELMPDLYAELQRFYGSDPAAEP